MIPHKTHSIHPFLLLALILSLPLLGPALLTAETESPAEAGTGLQRLSGAWTGGPLLAQPAELAEAGQEAGAATEWAIVILYESQDFRFDAQSRLVRNFHRVYHVADAAALESWSNLTVVWEPWHQRRPSIGARVITPDGREHVLDPATLVEEPVGSSDPAIQTDRRQLRAILPAMGVGATVEEWYEVVDEEPRFAAGVTRSLSLVHWYEILDRRIRVSAPTELPLHWYAEGLEGLEPKVSERRGRRILDFRPEPTDAFEGVEGFLPGDVVAWPRLMISTAPSWRAVAEHYGQQVDAAIGNADLSAELKDARGKARSRDRVAQQLMAWIDERVRYNGLELSEASILPRSPSETLKRHYGDCKDKATLLVALMRQAGFDARVALLNTGWGRDVEPRTPGFGHFDHAIVYVPGEPALWIDATANHMRVGDLPFMDQDRLALVTGPPIPGVADAVAEGVLVRTPLDRPEDNRVEEVRTLRLPALPGKGFLADLSRAWGLEAQALRSDYRSIENEGLEEALREQMVENLQAEAVTGLSWSGLGDYEQPFTVEVEAERVSWALTDMDEGFVGRDIEDIFEDLPAPLFADAEPRAQDLLLRPAIYQSRHRVEVPLGFELVEPKEGLEVAVGPGVYRETIEQIDERNYEWTLYFETGPARWTAEQVQAGREALAGLLEDTVHFLLFQSRIEAQLEAGQVREALDAARALPGREPEEAMHRARLARALLKAGLSPRAREEARAAIEMAPEEPVLHEILGNTLETDELGRTYGPGFDQEGAVAAYRRALELDPDHSDTLVDLVNILIRNADGEVYGPGTPLAEATEAAWAVVEPLPSAQNYEVLTVLLWLQDHHGEVRDLVEGLDDGQITPYMRSAHIASRIILEGVDTALAELGPKALNGQESGQALLLLWARRHYAEATVVAEKIISGHQNAARMLGLLEMLRGLRPMEELEIDLATPEGVIRRILIALSQGDLETLESLFSEDIADSIEEDGALDELQDLLAGKASLAEQPELGFLLETAFDLVLSRLTLELEEDGTGDGLLAKGRVDLFGNKASWDIVLVKEEDQPKAFALTAETERLLERTADHLEAGRTDVARTWMRWAFEALPEPDPDDPWSAFPSAQLWWRGPGADDPAGEIGEQALAEQLDRILTVHQVELGKSESLDALRGLLAAEDDDGIRLHLERALVVGLLQSEPYSPEVREELLALTAALFERYPEIQEARRLRVGVLIDMDRESEAQALLEARIEEDPDNLELHRDLSVVHAAQGDLDGAIRVLEKLEERSLATGFDLNNLSWYLLFRDPPERDRAFELARRSVEDQGYSSDAGLHTLATILAEQDRPLEARQVALQAMAAGDAKDPRPHDFLVFARIAETLGEPDLARQLYERTREIEEEEEEYFTSWDLAREHLERLDAKKR